MECLRRAVLLNDTSYVAHHGSRHVVDVIHRGLAKYGIAITASVRAGGIWTENQQFLDELTRADVIIINGEGTLHHGAGHGERLLRIVNHPLRRKRPVAIINALWQENPPEWASLLRRADIISVRDGRSQRALNQLGIDAHFCPDFSFYPLSPRPHETRDESRVAFGDSVYPDTSKALWSAYKNANGVKVFLPIRSRIRHRPRATGLSLEQRLDNLRHKLRTAIFRQLDGRHISARDVPEYLSELCRCGLHITGRYHAACLSIATFTPFRAIISNSSKIEALIEDIGLDPRRIMPTVEDALKGGLLPYSDVERNNIQKWLVKSRIETENCFHTLENLL